MDLQILWEITQKGGALGILFLTNIMLWLKIDKKEKEISSLIEILTKNTILQEQSNQLLQKVSDNIIQLISKK